MALESLQELYVEQLKDLHSAEEQIIEALPKMIEKASHAELRQAFEAHLRQTREQLRRLDQIGQRAGQKLTGHKCKGMAGLLEEGEETLKERADSDVLDAALIAAAQRVEHYEMAGYGCAHVRAPARARRRPEAAAADARRRRRHRPSADRPRGARDQHRRADGR